MAEVGVDAPPNVGTETTIKTSSNHYNQSTKQIQLIHEELNSAINHPIIIKRIKDGKARDVADEPKANDTPAFILGSGPSLDDSIKYLKQWKGGIFCTTSHALTLMYYGIEPTHIVALDPFCQWSEIEGVDWSKTKTKLVCHPGIWPDLVEKWPNEMLLYIENLGRLDSFYATTQKHQYSWREASKEDIRTATFHYYIRTEVTLFACSPPVQMFMAQILGYGTVFLAGVDFCYTNEKERFTSYTVNVEKTNDPANFELGEKKLIWDKHESPTNPNDKDYLIMNNGKRSHVIHLYYKKNWVSSWRLSGQTVYTTDHGAITEVPYTSIEKVIRKQGQDYQKQFPAYIAKQTETYLASVGAFVVETKEGISFVEAEDPKVDMVKYMENLYKQYYCTTCHQNLLSNDMKNHENEECPRCKNKTIQHRYHIDIEWNIKKFIRLLNFIGKSTSIEEWIAHSEVNDGGSIKESIKPIIHNKIDEKEVKEGIKIYNQNISPNEVPK